MPQPSPTPAVGVGRGSGASWAGVLPEQDLHHHHQAVGNHQKHCVGKNHREGGGVGEKNAGGLGARRKNCGRWPPLPLPPSKMHAPRSPRVHASVWEIDALSPPPSLKSGCSSPCCRRNRPGCRIASAFINSSPAFKRAYKLKVIALAAHRRSAYSSRPRLPSSRQQSGRFRAQQDGMAPSRQLRPRRLLRRDPFLRGPWLPHLHLSRLRPNWPPALPPWRGPAIPLQRGRPGSTAPRGAACRGPLSDVRRLRPPRVRRMLAR